MNFSPEGLEELRNRIAGRFEARKHQIAVRGCVLVSFRGGVTWLVPPHYARTIMALSPRIYSYMEMELGRPCYLAPIATF
jgi:hypothetical protein